VQNAKRLKTVRSPTSGLGSLLVTPLFTVECLELRKLRKLLTTLTTPFKNMSTSNGYLTFYDGPLVWIDCEMTGLDYKTDRILEIAVSAIDLSASTSGPFRTDIF